MNKKLIFIFLIPILLIGSVLYIAVIKQSDNDNRTFLIGIVVRGKSYEPGVMGFKEKMQELGFQENNNVKYIIRFTDKQEGLSAIIKEFIDSNVDLIHSYSTPATIEAYKQTKTIPIIFGSMGDPLASGVVKSLVSSGTNVTGIASLSVDLTAKRLEFLKEIFPSIRKVAIPYSIGDIPGKRSVEVAQEGAPKLGITIIPYPITAERGVKETASAIFKKDVDGMIVSADSAVWANLSSYIAQAKDQKIPFAVFDKNMVEKGGLVGYGPDYFAVGKQAAVLANKILKGTKPENLPIESPNKLILAINLKTAAENNFLIPDKFLSKADLIIK